MPSLLAGVTGLHQWAGGYFQAVSKWQQKQGEPHLTLKHSAMQNALMPMTPGTLGIGNLDIVVLWLSWRLLVSVYGRVCPGTQESIKDSLLLKWGQEPNGSWVWPFHVYWLLWGLWWAVCGSEEWGHHELSKMGEQSGIDLGQKHHCHS